MKNSSKWFEFISEREEANYNLFCFPHAGAGASTYASWGKVVSEKCNIYPVQYPMRETRMSELMPSNVQELAKLIVEENESLFHSKPVVLFGQCLGAYIAYETALAIQKQLSITPALLVVASSESPHKVYENTLPEIIDNQELAEHFANLGYIDKSLIGNKPFMDFFMPVLKTDYALTMNYRSENHEKVHCKILATRGKDDLNIETGMLKNWQAYTTEGICIKEYNGGHFFINKDNISSFSNDIISEISC